MSKVCTLQHVLSRLIISTVDEHHIIGRHGRPAAFPHHDVSTLVCYKRPHAGGMGSSTTSEIIYSTPLYALLKPALGPFIGCTLRLVLTSCHKMQRISENDPRKTMVRASFELCHQRLHIHISDTVRRRTLAARSVLQCVPNNALRVTVIESLMDGTPRCTSSVESRNGANSIQICIQGSCRPPPSNCFRKGFRYQAIKTQPPSAASAICNQKAAIIPILICSPPSCAISHRAVSSSSIR
jgi:hypothetical protein